MEKDDVSRREFRITTIFAVLGAVTGILAIVIAALPLLVPAAKYSRLLFSPELTLEQTGEPTSPVLEIANVGNDDAEWVDVELWTFLKATIEVLPNAGVEVSSNREGEVHVLKYPRLQDGESFQIRVTYDPEQLKACLDNLEGDFFDVSVVEFRAGDIEGVEIGETGEEGSSSGGC